MSEHDALLQETIARHFPAAEIRDDHIALGVGELEIACWVNDVRETRGLTSASLFFSLRGGELGDAPVFASISGYGPTAEAAIATGACNWACAFGPVLRAGLTDEAVPEVSTFSITIDGQDFDVFVDALDRAMSLDASEVPIERMAAARARFAPDHWLTRVAIESGGLPMLAPDRPTVLSVFVSDAPGHRVVEVKVDGCDWPHMSAAFADVDHERGEVILLMRELAILVPASRATKLDRTSIQRTLDGIADLTKHRNAAHWPGWQHHGGVLAPALSADELARVEAITGELPSDYRHFLLEVASSGAGPGYGLLPPSAAIQAELAPGDFTWEDESSPTVVPQGVLALAHAGCGVMWLLVLRGDHRGEVWVDARRSDGYVRLVARSFSAWYRDWLATAVRNSGAFLGWDPMHCAMPNVLQQVITSFEQKGVTSEELPAALANGLRPGAIALANSGPLYFADQQPLNPCQGCVELAARFSLEASVFAPGIEPE
jgi:hypothetical protein